MTDSEALVVRRARLRFAISFVAVAGLLFTVYCFPYAESGAAQRCFDGYLRMYARMTGAVLSLVEPHLTVVETQIIGRFSLRIVKNCDAMDANILFCAATVAFPGAFGARLVALFAGLATLVAINVLRICTLYYVGVYAPSSFEVIHLEVWPFLMVGMAATVFLLGARWMQHERLALPTPVMAAES